MRADLTEKVYGFDLLLLLLAISISGGIFNISVAFIMPLILSLLIMLGLLGVRIFDKFRYGAIKNATLMLFFIALLFLVKYLLSGVGQGVTKYALYFLNSLAALLILIRFSRRKSNLLRAIYIALIIVMVHALLSFLLWFVVKNNLTYIDSLKCNTFGNIFYYLTSEFDTVNEKRMVDLFGLQFIRNSGIFWEPGILQMYLNMLLFISLFHYKNTIVAILSIAVIITTWSTTGLFILSIQMGYLAFIHARKGKFVYLVLSAGFFAAVISFGFVGNLEDKIHGSHAGSGFARMLDTLTAVNVVAANPILGIALDSEEHDLALQKYRAVINVASSNENRDAAKSNSILNYFVFFGIPLGVLIVMQYYQQKIVIKRRALFFIIITISLSFEPIGIFVFPLIVMFSGALLRKE